MSEWVTDCKTDGVEGRPTVFQQRRQLEDSIFSWSEQLLHSGVAGVNTHVICADLLLLPYSFTFLDRIYTTVYIYI